MSARVVECPNPKIAVIGAVGSTEAIIARLAANGMRLVGVAGLAPDSSKNVSGFCDLSAAAKNAGAEYLDFKNLNEPQVVEAVKRWAPDILFVAGISQLAHKEIMSAASKLNVGFHPTMLPVGRGRAPLAWITYDCANAAATLFELTEGADEGDIIAQIPFDVSPDDHALDVAKKLDKCIAEAMDAMCASIKNEGLIRLVPQDSSKATYNGIRRPNDGFIDWSRPAREVYALIRAASDPHPGAFTYAQNGERKLVVMRAEFDESLGRMRGVEGRVLAIEGDCAIVQTGTTPIRLTRFFFEDAPDENAVLKVGEKLGVNFISQIEKLKAELSEVKAALGKLKGKSDE